MTTCVLDVAPAKVGLAGRAMNNLPGVARKPGKFVTGKKIECHAWGELKAAYFIRNARRIEKSVMVAAADRDGVLFGGDGVGAVAAVELVLLILGRLLQKRGSLPNEGFLFTFATITSDLLPCRRGIVLHPIQRESISIGPSQAMHQHRAGRYRFSLLSAAMDCL